MDVDNLKKRVKDFLTILLKKINGCLHAYSRNPQFKYGTFKVE